MATPTVRGKASASNATGANISVTSASYDVTPQAGDIIIVGAFFDDDINRSFFAGTPTISSSGTWTALGSGQIYSDLFAYGFWAKTATGTTADNFTISGTSDSPEGVIVIAVAVQGGGSFAANAVVTTSSGTSLILGPKGVSGNLDVLIVGGAVDGSSPILTTPAGTTSVTSKTDGSYAEMVAVTAAADGASGYTTTLSASGYMAGVLVTVGPTGANSGTAPAVVGTPVTAQWSTPGATATGTVSWSAHDIVVVGIGVEGNSTTTKTTVSSVTATGLTFQRYTEIYGQSSTSFWNTASVWYAIASSSGSSAVTATFGGQPYDDANAVVMVISGADTTNPFDPNAANPALGYNTQTVSGLATSSSSDLIIAFQTSEENINSGTPTSSGGWTVSNLVPTITNGGAANAQLTVVDSGTASSTMTAGSYTGRTGSSPLTVLFALQPPGSSSIAGTGSLTGTFTASGTAKVVVSGSGSVVGSFTASATAQTVVPGTASLTGAFTAAAAGATVIPATASLTGTFTAAATGSVTVHGTASAAATFTAAGTGTIIIAGTAALTGTFTATGTGTVASVTYQGSAAFNGTFTASAAEASHPDVIVATVARIAIVATLARTVQVATLARTVQVATLARTVQVATQSRTVTAETRTQ